MCHNVFISRIKCNFQPVKMRNKSLVSVLQTLVMLILTFGRGVKYWSNFT